MRQLRENGDVIFELVAEGDAGLEGHVLYSRLWAESPHLFGALAPLAVLPDRQGSGVGSRLVKSSLECAREFGCHGLLVLGDPAYYGRFGFKAETAAQVGAPFAGLAAFQGLALEPGAFDQPLFVGYPEPFGA